MLSFNKFNLQVGALTELVILVNHMALSVVQYLWKKPKHNEKKISGHSDARILEFKPHTQLRV